MIALDTNVLVRFLVQDDLEQTQRVRRLVEGQIERDEAFFVADIVLAELVWVLGVTYKVRRAEISRLLNDLLRARHLTFQSGERFSRALKAYSAGQGDFADYMILEQARAANCEAVVTFDGDLLREDRFVAVP